MTFPKKSVFDPPNRPKSHEREVQSTWDQKICHFLTKTKPHAKN